jgi:tRNA dimethylallyltransferase
LLTLSIAPKSAMQAAPAAFPSEGGFVPGNSPELETGIDKISPLVAVVGPTASGKSEIALTMAETFGGEIINFDSVQIYRDFNIGSAKLPVAARRGVPHHLLDVVGLEREVTAGAFAEMARNVLRDLRKRSQLPVFVGGTGFYLRALLEGLSPAPGRDPTLRERLSKVEKRRPGALYRFLTRHDPLAASRIHAKDSQKLIRAVEMTVLGRQPASATQNQPRKSLQGYAVLKIGLMPERSQLYKIIDSRSRRMFESGLVEETRALLDWGVSEEAKPLGTLGYKQAAAVVAGRVSLEEAIRECQLRTRQYAKRQLTWFRADPEVQWLAGFGSDPGIREQALEKAREFLEDLRGSQHNLSR